VLGKRNATLDTKSALEGERFDDVILWSHTPALIIAGEEKGSRETTNIMMKQSEEFKIFKIFKLFRKFDFASRH
jgi:hypothetical protein